MITADQPNLGFNTRVFWALSSRLVPCGPAHLMIAIDLNSRFFWWDADLGAWDLVPEAEHKRLFNQIQAWQAVAWQALQQLAEFLEKGEKSPEGSAAFDRFFAIQYSLMRVQELSCPWQRGWLYRSLCLDHRWLLREMDVPPFDEYMFSLLLLDAPAASLSDETIHWLQKDPIISAMPALHDVVYPNSWKTRILIDLRARKFSVTLEDVHAAIDRLVEAGSFNREQADLLRVSRKPLIGSAVEAAEEAVIQEVLIMLLDTSATIGGRRYQNFRLPTLDQALFVYPPD